MLHTVAPVLGQIGRHELVFLGVDGVGDMSGIAHRNLLVPALLSGCVLATEGIEAADGDVHVGQRQCDGGIAHVLVEVHRRAQRHAYARESGAPVDRRCTRALRHGLRIVHTVQVVALIAACGEVDACRQRVERIGLGILTVTPLYLEAGLSGVVGHSLVTGTCVLEAT